MIQHESSCPGSRNLHARLHLFCVLLLQPAPGPSMRLDGDADRNPPIGIATRPKKAASRTKEDGGWWSERVVHTIHHTRCRHYTWQPNRMQSGLQCSAAQENAVLSCTSVASTIGLTHAQPQPYGLIKAGKAHAPKKRAVSHPATHNSPMGWEGRERERKRLGRDSVLARGGV